MESLIEMDKLTADTHLLKDWCQKHDCMLLYVLKVAVGSQV